MPGELPQLMAKGLCFAQHACNATLVSPQVLSTLLIICFPANVISKTYANVINLNLHTLHERERNVNANTIPFQPLTWI